MRETVSRRLVRVRRFPLRTLAALAWLAALSLPVAAPASAQSAGWQQGPGAILDNTYTGYIDTPSNGASVSNGGSLTVGGWFVDTTAQGWAGADDMQVFLGQMGNGGTMVAHGIVAQNRPDVGAAIGNPYFSASGFSASVPGSALPAGSQTLNVYVHTGGKGWWFRSVSINVSAGGATASSPAPSSSSSGASTSGTTVTVTAPLENANVSTKNGQYTITGTVSPDVDRVDVWLNGERDTGTQLGTATPNSDGTWSVSFIPTHYPSTHSNLYVFARSKTTGKEIETVRGFNITDRSV